jgi:hypothetical protein
MRARVSVAAVVLGVVGLLWAATAAVAQDEQKATFAEAAALVDYPVLAPHRVLGLRPRVVTVSNLCVTSGGKRMVIAGYGRRSGRGPQFRILEAKPFVCGDAGESRPFRTVRIRGHRVAVRASCESPEPECALHTGRKHTFVALLRLRTGAKHRLTAIGLQSSHVSFNAFVRMARSLRPVRAAATVSLAEFLSSDGSVWCRIGFYGADDRWCAYHGADEFGASVAPDGTVTRCGTGQPAPRDFCTQNWAVTTIRLADGLSSDVGGYLCTDAQGTVTCTVKAGTGAGSGFRVGSAGSEVISPP